jgi:predicted dehydrogenase
MKPLQGALVGYGFIAEKGHLPAYEEARRSGLPVGIAAIADPCPARLRAALAKDPTLRVYDDARALFACERGRIDFVDITTPPSEHAALAHRGFDAGLHVLCEKPVATSAADARRMIAHATEAERVFFPSHNYKHAPVVKAVRRVIDEGLIGDVHLVTLHTFRNTHARGTSDWKPDWRRERRFSGGGIAMDHGSHTFYLAFDWFDGYPQSITAKASTLGDFDTEDNLSCSITFPRGVATAHLTWTAGVRKVIYTIHGTRGAVRVEDDRVEVSRMDDDGGRVHWDIHEDEVRSNWMDASHVTWFRSLFEQFGQAIERRDWVSKEACDSVMCIELIEAAYASARDGSRETAVRPLDPRRPAAGSQPCAAE